MARAFLKVYFSFDERTEALNELEKGRLLLAMLRYARTGEMPDLKGNERFCFSSLKYEIDQDVQAYEAKVANGNKGGRPLKSKPNETKDNLKKPNETEDNLNRKDLRTEGLKDLRTEGQTNANALVRTRRKPAPDALEGLDSRVQDAFRDFAIMRTKMRKPMTDRAVSLAVNTLINVAGNDPDEQLRTINRSIERGWISFYADDRGQQKQPAQRKVVAQQYTQRDYSREQLDQLFEVL